MRIIYLGTPDFAVKPLLSIIASGHEIAAVVCQPDRANARGNKVVYSPVKEIALERGIPVLQYGKIRFEGVEELRALDADIMITCAYGQILSQEILDLTKYGVINIHASLLPKYRGSSPVQRAIISGEKTIGVTIMQTVVALDAGDMILKGSIELDGENTVQALERLSELGADLIVEALSLIESGKAVFEKQNEAEATYHPLLKKEDGRIDFSLDAASVMNFIKGMQPWPGAYCQCKYGVLKLLDAEICRDENVDLTAEDGTILLADPKKGFAVKCGKGSVFIKKVQAENSKAMGFSDFLRGKPLEEGSSLC